jgi:hypothetical protein
MMQSKLDEQAQQMQQQIESNQQMAPMLQPMVTLMGKIAVTTEGNDAKVGVTLTSEEMSALPMIMMQMAMSGMGGGAPGGAGGTGGPPPGFPTQPSQ